jgi:tetratricopeptide (TPR) repeat protein
VQTVARPSSIAIAVVYGAAAVMRRTFHLLLVALVVLAAVPAGADEGDEVRARALYEKGMSHFQLDEFDAAITLWLEAYRFKPVPELLYNIAQAHRLKSERALAFYRKYLALNPRAANRAEVERHIEALERLLSEDPPKLPATTVVPKATAAPPKPVATPPKPIAPPPVKLAPTTVQPSRPALSAQVLVEPEAERSRPDKSVFKKPWLWATVGTVAVVVAVGVGLGVGLKSSDSTASFGIARGN